MLLAAPDALTSATLFRLTSDLRSQLDDAISELGTGYVGNATEALRGNNDVLLRAQAIVDASQPELTRLTILQGRYQTAATSLRSINEMSGAVALSALSADSATGETGPSVAATEAEAMTASILSTLNTQFGGRSLFAGDDGVGAAVTDADTFFTWVDGILAGATTAADKRAALDTEFAPGGGFDTNVYTGGAALTSPTLPGGEVITSLPTADDASIREILKGLAMVAVNETVDPAERQQWLSDGGALIQTSREELTMLEARIGLAENSIQRDVDRQDQVVFDAQTTIDNLIGVDPFESVSETQSLESRLQALYTVTGRTASLRLSNFL